MKRLLTLVLVILMIVLAGCAGQQPSEQESPAAPGDASAPPAGEEPAQPEEKLTGIVTWQESNAAQAADTEVQRGGTVTVAKYSNLSTGLNPCKNNQATVDASTLRMVYETLVNVDDGGNVIPGLATSWEVEDTGITFELRDDAYFTNGEQFSAETAAWTINWIMSEECAHNTARNNMPFITGAEVIDDFTFKINTSQLDISMLSTLSTIDGFMFSPQFVNEVGQEGMASQSCGTGPFVVSEYMEGEYIDFGANPDYYLNGADGQPLPYLDGVKVVVMPDDSVRLQNLQSGDVDIVEGYNGVETVNNSAELGDLVTVSTGLTTDWFIQFNWNDPITGDENFRKAVAYALDKDVLSDAVLKGLGTTTTFHATRDRWFYSDYEPYGSAADIEKAKEYLALSSYNGEEIDLSTISREPDNTIIVLLQQQLEAIGLTVKVNSMERLAWVDKVIVQGGGQISLAKCIQVGLDPAYEARDTYAFIPDKDVHCAELFALIDNLKTTVETEDRVQAFAEFQKYYKDQIFYEFLINLPQYAAYRNESVQGLRFMPNGFPELNHVWLKQ